jgi:hypothetical protein
MGKTFIKIIRPLLGFQMLFTRLHIKFNVWYHHAVDTKKCGGGRRELEID